MMVVIASEAWQSLKYFTMAIYNMAGHNLNDSGAIGIGGIKESDMTIEFKNLVSSWINHSQYKEINDLDRESLSKMLERLKPGDGSVCVEWHFNNSDNPKASGVEVIVDDNANELSRNFAKKMVDTIATILQIPNRGVKTSKDSARGRLAMPRMKGITMLPEICFNSNPDDLSKYNRNKIELAKAMAILLMQADDAIV